MPPCLSPGQSHSQPSCAAALLQWEPAQGLCTSNSSSHSPHWDALPDQEPTGGVSLELLCPFFFMEKEEIAVQLHRTAALQSSLLSTAMAKGEIFPDPHLQPNPTFDFSEHLGWFRALKHCRSLTPFPNHALGIFQKSQQLPLPFHACRCCWNSPGSGSEQHSHPQHPSLNLNSSWPPHPWDLLAASFPSPPGAEAGQFVTALEPPHTEREQSSF